MTASVGRCRYCRRFMFPAGSPQVRADADCMVTRDHLVPRSIGPIKLMDQPRNLAPACHGCNQTKGNAPPEVYAWFCRQPQVLEHTPAQRRQEFQRLCYALTLAGFKAATRGVLDRRPKRAGIVAAAFAEIPPDDEPVWMKGKVRSERGRFVRKVRRVTGTQIEEAWAAESRAIRQTLDRLAGKQVMAAALQVFIPPPQTDEEAARDVRIVSGQEEP